MNLVCSSGCASMEHDFKIIFVEDTTGLHNVNEVCICRCLHGNISRRYKQNVPSVSISMCIQLTYPQENTGSRYQWITRYIRIPIQVTCHQAWYYAMYLGTTSGCASRVHVIKLPHQVEHPGYISSSYLGTTQYI